MESWKYSRKFQVTWKPSLKPTYCGFFSFENGEACQSTLTMLHGKIGFSKPEVKKIGDVQSFLFLEEFKIYLSWNIS